MNIQASTNDAIAAGCVLHDGQSFVAICRRCGSYMCAECTSEGQYALCPPCRERTHTSAFPFSRTAFVWGDLIRHAFRAYRKNLAAVTLALLALTVPLIAFNLASLVLTERSDSAVTSLLLLFAGSVVQAIVQAFLTLSALTIVLQVAQGHPVNLGEAMARGRRIVAFFLLGLAINVIVMGGMLVALAPFLIVSLLSDSFLLASLLAGLLATFGVAALGYLLLGTLFGYFELVLEPRLGALDALRNSWQIARAARGPILFGLFLEVILAFLGLLLCGVGALFTLGLGFVLFATLYLTLRNGTPNLRRAQASPP